MSTQKYNFTKSEQAYLNRHDPETQAILSEDPVALRNLVRQEIAQHLYNQPEWNPDDSFDSALERAEQEMVAYDAPPVLPQEVPPSPPTVSSAPVVQEAIPVPPEEPSLIMIPGVGTFVPSTLGVTSEQPAVDLKVNVRQVMDVSKSVGLGVVQVPMTLAVRSADFLKTNILATTVDALDMLKEGITGTPLVTEEVRKSFYQEMTPEEERTWVTFGNFLPTNTVSEISRELGTFGVAFIGTTLAAPFLLPAKVMAKSAQWANHSSKIVSLTTRFLQANLKGSLVSATVGSKVPFGEVTAGIPQVSKLFNRSPEENTKAFKTWFNNLYPYEKFAYRFIEDSALSLIAEVSFGALSKGYNALVKSGVPETEVTEALVKTADSIYPPGFEGQGTPWIRPEDMEYTPPTSELPAFPKERELTTGLIPSELLEESTKELSTPLIPWGFWLPDFPAKVELPDFPNYLPDFPAPSMEPTVEQLFSSVWAQGSADVFDFKAALKAADSPEKLVKEVTPEVIEEYVEVAPKVAKKISAKKIKKTEEVIEAQKTVEATPANNKEALAKAKAELKKKKAEEKALAEAEAKALAEAEEAKAIKQKPKEPEVTPADAKKAAEKEAKRLAREAKLEAKAEAAAAKLAEQETKRGESRIEMLKRLAEERRRRDAAAATIAPPADGVDTAKAVVKKLEAPTPEEHIKKISTMKTSDVLPSTEITPSGRTVDTFTKRQRFLLQDDASKWSQFTRDRVDRHGDHLLVKIQGYSGVRTNTAIEADILWVYNRIKNKVADPNEIKKLRQVVYESGVLPEGLTPDSPEFTAAYNKYVTQVQNEYAEVVAKAREISKKDTGRIVQLLDDGTVEVTDESYSMAFQKWQNFKKENVKASVEEQRRLFREAQAAQEAYEQAKRITKKLKTKSENPPNVSRFRNPKKGAVDLEVMKDLAFTLAKVASKNPGLTAVGAMGAYDFLSDTNFTLGDYLTAAGAAMGIRHLGNLARVSRYGFTPELLADTKALLASNQLELLSLAKGNADPRVFFGVAEDLLSQVQTRFGPWVRRIERELPTMGNRTFDPSVDLSDIMEAFPTGEALGNPKFIPDEIFLSPSILRDSVVDLYKHLESKITQQINPKFSAALKFRKQAFVEDYGLSATALRYFDDMTGGTDQNWQHLLVTLDSMERKLLDGIYSILKDPVRLATNEGKASLSEELGKFRLFRSYLNHPLSMMNPEVVDGPLNQMFTAKFLRTMPEDLPKGPAFERFRDAMSAQEAYLRQFFDNGEVPESMRKKFFTFIDDMGKTKITAGTIWRCFLSGTYHSMLSSPKMLANSVVGNTLSVTREATSNVISGILSNLLTPGNRGAIANMEFISGLWEGFGPGVANAQRTVETGVKSFDFLGTKNYYPHKAAQDFARSVGGSAESTPAVLRFFERTVELFGAPPGNIVKAIDVLPQTMLHRGYYRKFLMQEYDKVSTLHKIPMSEARKLVDSNPDLVAQLSDKALQYSRGAVFIGPSPVQQVRNVGEEGFQVVDEITPVGHAIEDIAGFQQNWPGLSLIYPFLSTNLFSHYQGWRYNPLALAGTELLHTLRNPEQVMTLSQAMRLGKDLNQITKNQIERGLMDTAGRFLTGSVISLGLLGWFGAAGYEYVSSLTSVDAKEKRKGMPSAGFRKDNGEFIRFDMMDDWMPTMALLDVAYRGITNDLDRETEGDYIFGSLAMELIADTLTPQGLKDFWGKGKDLFNTRETPGEAILELISDTIKDALGRMEPQAYRMFRDWSAGYVSRRSKNPFTKSSHRKLGATGLPVETSPLTPIGTWGKIEGGELEDTLAANGIPVKDMPQMKFGGVPIDDFDLQELIVTDARKELLAEFAEFKRILKGLGDNQPEKTKATRAFYNQGLQGAYAKNYNKLKEFLKSKGVNLE